MRSQNILIKTLWLVTGIALLALLILWFYSFRIDLVKSPALAYDLEVISLYLKGAVIMPIFIYILMVSLRFLFVSVRAHIRKDDTHISFSRGAVQKFVKQVQSEVIQAIYVFFPAIVSIFITGEVMQICNSLNAHRLKDISVLHIDQWVTHTIPFIYWSTGNFPYAFIEGVIWSYVLLPVSLIFFSIYLFAFHRKYIYGFLLALTIANFLMIPLWNVVPVLSPYNRFVLNVYHEPMPPDVEKSLSDFHPGAPLQEILDKEKKTESKSFAGGAYPSSSIPSAHAAWATILAIYIFKANRKLFIPVVIFTILSTLGTFILLQHYFIDAPLGVLMGFFAVFVVEKIGKWGKVAEI